jgi:hypothetical protein
MVLCRVFSLVCPLDRKSAAAVVLKSQIEIEPTTTSALLFSLLLNNYDDWAFTTAEFFQ